MGSHPEEMVLGKNKEAGVLGETNSGILFLHQ